MDPSACPSAAWVFNTTFCPADACLAYSANCSACASAPSTLQCGWCEDTRTCLTGDDSAPIDGMCSADGWSWMSCGSAALCAEITDCTDCLQARTIDGSACGFCTATATCSLGTSMGPYPGSSTSCPAWKWSWSSFTTDYTPCYRPTPFQHESAAWTDWDMIALGVVGGTLVILITMVFIYGHGCGKSPRCTPRWGEWKEERVNAKAKRGKRKSADGIERIQRDGAMVDGQDIDEYSGVYDNGLGGEASIPVRPCTDCNCILGKLLMWLLSISSLGLGVTSLALDRWSQSVANLWLLQPQDQPLMVQDGALDTRLALGHDKHGGSSYTYDCAALNDNTPAHVECLVHTYGGIFTLACGLVGACLSFIVAVMASRDLCRCGSRDPDEQVNVNVRRGSFTLAQDENHRRYPFTVTQWRVSVFAGAFCMSAVCFWCGSYLMTRQWMTEFMPGLSAYFMAGAAACSFILALVYRYAIRVTPIHGYSCGVEPLTRCHSPSPFLRAEEPLLSDTLKQSLAQALKQGAIRDEGDKEPHHHRYASFQTLARNGVMKAGANIQQQEGRAASSSPSRHVHTHGHGVSHHSRMVSSVPTSSSFLQASVGGAAFPAASGSSTLPSVDESNSSMHSTPAHVQAGYVPIPWQTYMESGVVSPDGTPSSVASTQWVPPPGFVLVPVTQAAQFMQTDQNNIGVSSASMPPIQSPLTSTLNQYDPSTSTSDAFAQDPSHSSHSSRPPPSSLPSSQQSPNRGHPSVQEEEEGHVQGAE